DQGIGAIRRRRLQLVFPLRLEALSPQVVRRRASVRAEALPADGADAAANPVGEGGDVRGAAVGRTPDAPSRSLRRIAALSLGPAHGERRWLLDRRRRPAL